MIMQIAVGITLSVVLLAALGILIMAAGYSVVKSIRIIRDKRERDQDEYENDDEDYYTEEDFDLPEMDKDIQAKQMEQEVKERIKDWFAKNDIEMQEEE